jgi:hypothetical protein
VNIVGTFQNFNVPIAFETDVNAPAMTEAALRGDTSAAYITIGTGIFIENFSRKITFSSRCWCWSCS